MQAPTLSTLVGRNFKSVGRTLSEDDFSAFLQLSWIGGTPHTDREYMQAHSPFGDVILPGPCVYACVVGLTGTSGILECIRATGLVGLALLNVSDLSFRSPVLPGDTLLVECSIESLRQSQRAPERFVIGISETASNQRGQLILTAQRTILAAFPMEDADPQPTSSR